MTAAEAVQVLAQATEPQMAGRISRTGYARIEEALVLLGELHPMSEGGLGEGGLGEGEMRGGGDE